MTAAPAKPFATREQTVALSVSFLALFAIVGCALYGLPFFYDFFVRELGWTRAQVTSGNAFGKSNVIPRSFIAVSDMRFVDAAQRDRARARMREIVAQGLPSGCYPLDPFYAERPEAAELKEIKQALRA